MGKIFEADEFRNLMDATYKAPFVKTFTDVAVSNWVADTTYSGYGYKCEIAISGVLSTDYVEVILGHTEAVSGNYSPICVTGTGIVTIYSKVNTTIIIPTILINKQS